MQTRPRPVRYRKKNKRKKVSKPGPSGLDLRPHQIVLKPLVTEKGTHQSTRYNAYTFEVNLIATKDQIKAAVEELFNVKVDKVRTQIRMGKTKRYRFREGKQADWKKAIVTLQGEDRIEFF